jgi:hypothetical protein
MWSRSPARISQRLVCKRGEETRDRVKVIAEGFIATDERIDSVDARLGSVDKRLGSVDNRISAMEKRRRTTR